MDDIRNAIMKKIIDEFLFEPINESLYDQFKRRIEATFIAEVTDLIIEPYRIMFKLNGQPFDILVNNEA